MNALLQAIRSVDVSVYHFLSASAGNWLLDHLVSHEESDNLLKGGLFFAIYVYFWFRVDPDQKKRRRAIIAVITASLLALVISRTVASLAPFRIRPMYLPHRPYAFPVSHNMENWSSFPSDTAAYFFALAYGLMYLMRRYAALIILYTAVWICLPRMFLGEHYLSDILVGAAIGILLAWASLRSEWLQSIVPDRALAFMNARPHAFYAAAFLVCFEMGVLFDNVRSVGRALARVALEEPLRDFRHVALDASIPLGFIMIAGYGLWIFWRRHGVPKRNLGTLGLSCHHNLELAPEAEDRSQAVSRVG